MSSQSKEISPFAEMSKAAAEDSSANRWENRLLGRPSFNMPSLAERPGWGRWRVDHEAPIDLWVSRALSPKERAGQRIDAVQLAASWEYGWCPYYMARWHTVFAAIMANMRLGWAPFECERVLGLMVDQDERGDVRPRSHGVQAETLIADRRRASRTALGQIAGEAAALRAKIAAYDSIGCDAPDLSALTPQRAGAYSRALNKVRGHLRALTSELEALEALTGNPDAVQPANDVETWCYEFAGYMGVGWFRMTGKVIGEGNRCIDLLEDAFNSLWPAPPEPRDWRVKARWARNHSPVLGQHPRLTAHPFGRPGMQS